MSNPAAIPLVLGTVVIVAAGCGGRSNSASGGSGQTTAGPGRSKTISIDETEYRLTPSSVSLDEPGS